MCEEVSFVPSYINRDISWLSFNYRVLEEAKDKNLSLYERIKFLAIYANNLDEFYRVRVASYRHLEVLSQKSKSKLDYDPDEVLEQINETVKSQLEEHEHIFVNEILPELKDNNIHLHQHGHYNKEQLRYARDFFLEDLLPYLQPVLLTSGEIRSFLQDNVIYLAFKLYRKKKKKAGAENSANDPAKRKTAYAIIKVPTHRKPRFVVLPKHDGKYHITFLEDVIRYNSEFLFPGYDIDCSHTIVLSRDADLQIEDEFSGNLVEKIRKSLARRKTGAPCRFMYDDSMPADLLDRLEKAFKLDKADLVPSGRYQLFSQFFGFPNPMEPDLEERMPKPLYRGKLDYHNSIFEAIRERDWVLHFPYHSYDYVIRFLNEAAFDPKVEEIKVTQYRVASNSAVVNSLISAARNGKKVTVFVEVKARFDEKNNIMFAEIMKEAGIKIISSIPGIKVHAKVALVLRKAQKDLPAKGFAFLSTGNFNEKTAKIYGDHGLFTQHDGIINDLSNLFVHLADPTKKNFEFKHMLIGQFNMTETYFDRIDREIRNVEQGGKGYILLKMNGLEDAEIINKLYEASVHGVKIDVIVRGVCRLVPGKEYSANINLVRIVDSYLEHARVYVFHNNGENETFFSSADWMGRNLYRRIETGVPIYDAGIKQELLDILAIQLTDNVKACHIGQHGENIRKIRKDDEHEIRSQRAIHEYLMQLD